MQRELPVFLWDIKTAGTEILGFVARMSYDDYIADTKTRKAVERNFEIIGEAIKRGAEAFPDQFAMLPDASDFARFRDRLAHGYFNIEYSIVWETIQTNLPSLLQAVEKLLPTKQDLNR